MWTRAIAGATPHEAPIAPHASARPRRIASARTAGSALLIGPGVGGGAVMTCTLTVARLWACPTVECRALCRGESRRLVTNSRLVKRGFRERRRPAWLTNRAFSEAYGLSRAASRSPDRPAAPTRV